MTLRVHFVQAPLHGAHCGERFLPNLGAPSGLFGIEHGTLGYGMLHLATQVAREHEVQVWSLSAAALTGSLYPSLLKIVAGDVVGIQMNWGIESRGALSLASYLKAQNPQIRILVGGTHASLFANDIAQYPYVDAVIRGEAELVVPMLLRQLESCGRFDGLPGVVTADVDGGYAPVIMDIDAIEPYNPSLIATPVGRSIPWAVNRVRGACPWACTYCIGGHMTNVSGRACMRFHSPEWVKRQLDLLIACGAEFIMFQDQAWVAKTGAGSEPCSYLDWLWRELGESDQVWKVKYGIREAAAPSLPAETIMSMKRGNVTFIDYGCESGSPKILGRMGRRYSVEQMCSVIKETHEQGIVPGTWWTAGYPGETFEDVQQTIQAVTRTVRCGGLPMWVTPLVVLPGTALYERPDDFGITDLWQGFQAFQALADVDKARVAVNEYEYLITHETNVQSRRDIIEATWRIRTAVQDLRAEALETVSERFFEDHPAFTRDMLPQFGANEEHAAASYF